MEYNDFINSIQEFGLKDTSNLIHDPAFHALVILSRIISRSETELLRIYDCLRSRIGCHDYTGILKITPFAVRIGNVSFVEHLQ